jgi:hypothetical protein
LRAQIKRRQRTRRIIILGVAVVIVAIVALSAFFLSSLTSPLEKQVGQPVSSAVYQGMYTVSQATYGTADKTLMGKVQPFSGQPFLSGTKPIIVYIGGDFCPYCAFQRWPLIMALMRFGNFSSLAFMLSSSTDIYPNSPTFTFHGSKYTSNYVVFQSYEQEDRSRQQLDTVPSNYTNVFSQFGSSYPFIDFANRYVMSGSFYFPDQLDGKNWTQIVQLLSSNNVVSNQIISSTSAITAAICKVTSGAPSSVCGNGAISGLTAVLAAYHRSASATSKDGTPVSSPATRASLHYELISRNMNSATEIRYHPQT